MLKSYGKTEARYNSECICFIFWASECLVAPSTFYQFRRRLVARSFLRVYNPLRPTLRKILRVSREPKILDSFSGGLDRQTVGCIFVARRDLQSPRKRSLSSHMLICKSLQRQHEIFLAVLHVVKSR